MARIAVVLSLAIFVELLRSGMRERILDAEPMLHVSDWIVKHLKNSPRGHEDRRAYYGIGLMTLVLVTVIPAAAVFKEAHRVYMDGLIAYGRAYYQENQIARARTLQADAARISPNDYATAMAQLISLPMERKASGIYASPEVLFPTSTEQMADAAISGWPPISTETLYASPNAAQPKTCAGDRSRWQLMAFIASIVPGVDETSKILHGFLPRFDSASSGPDCAPALQSPSMTTDSNAKMLAGWPQNWLARFGVFFLAGLGAMGIAARVWTKRRANRLSDCSW